MGCYCVLALISSCALLAFVIGWIVTGFSYYHGFIYCIIFTLLAIITVIVINISMWIFERFIKPKLKQVDLDVSESPLNSSTSTLNELDKIEEDEMGINSNDECLQHLSSKTSDQVNVNMTPCGPCQCPSPNLPKQQEKLKESTPTNTKMDHSYPI